MKTKISYVSGVEGNSMYIGDIRVGGPKPWGGGRVLGERMTNIKSILYALNNIFDPAHQPLKTDVEEAELLLKNIDSGRGPNRCVCDKCGQPHDPNLVSLGSLISSVERY